jgi:hypothetical protein
MSTAMQGNVDFQINYLMTILWWLIMKDKLKSLPSIS